MAIVNALIAFGNWIWGIPMLVIFVGGGVFLTVYLGFFQFRYFGFMMKETFGKIFHKGEGEGTVSPFQAATAALASSIGAANIVGVPVAIATGGPGAIFWMWITGLVGIATKFSEIVLGIKYRVQNEDGVYIGGPMYYLANSKLPFLGTLFAFFLMIEIGPSISTQAVSVVQSAATIGINKTVVGVVLVVVVGLVTFGGIQRIATFTEKMVPLMASIFLLGAFIIIFRNASHIPAAFGMIFKNAFTPTAAVGGFAGSTLAAGIRNGIARGAYSNEAGMGTAPIAHTTAITDHPARQGMWAVYEIVMDTMIVCTATALVVLTTGIWTQVEAANAGQMPSLAFQQAFGTTFGGGIITVCTLLFVLSTIIVIAFYGAAQAEFLFGVKAYKPTIFAYLICIVVGVIADIDILYNIVDVTLATIIIPNMIGLIMFRDEIKEAKDEFFGDPKYYPGAK